MTIARSECRVDLRVIKMEDAEEGRDFPFMLTVVLVVVYA